MSIKTTLAKKMRGVLYRNNLIPKESLKKESKDFWRERFYPPISVRNSRRMSKEETKNI